LRARSFGQSQNRQSRRRRAQIEPKLRIALTGLSRRLPVSLIFKRLWPAFYVFEHVFEHDVALPLAPGIFTSSHGGTGDDLPFSIVCDGRQLHSTRTRRRAQTPISSKSRMKVAEIFASRKLNSRRRVMDRFIQRLNIEHYERLLQILTDESVRQRVSMLLEEERAKQATDADKRESLAAANRS
jgi:hypothetical protein